jgi:hypothetical protein
MRYDEKYIGVRVREVGSSDSGFVIYMGYLPKELVESVKEVALKEVDFSWKQFGDIEVKKVASDDYSFEEYTSGGCQASYGCSQCVYYDQCPEGQYYF